MSVVLGPIESSALCAIWAMIPPADGKAQCANGAFQVGIFSYKVDLGPDGVSDVVRRNLRGAPWDCINGECDWSYGPDVIFEMFDNAGAPMSRWGMSRPQEIASRQLDDFLSDYTFKLLAVRGAAILLADKLVTLQHELGYVHLYDLMADLYKAGWRDLDGWTTAINRPKQGWVDVTSNFASADAFWLAHEYQRLAAATQESPPSGYPFPKVMMPPSFGVPYQSTQEILATPATSEFGDFRAPDAFLVHRQIDMPQGSFLIDEDQTLTPLLRSSTVPEVAFYLYRTFKTLSTAYENLLKAKKSGEQLTGLIIPPAILDLFAQQSGGISHHSGPIFVPRGGSGGGGGLIFDDAGGGSGDSGSGGSSGGGDGAGGGTGETQKPSITSPRTWPTAAKVVAGVAVAAAVGVAAVAATGGFAKKP